MEFLNGSLGFLVIIGLVVLFICWVLLPFAVFGTKPLLNSILAEMRKTNELLQAQRGRAQLEDVAKQ
jgi:hypothetical protein